MTYLAWGVATLSALLLGFYLGRGRLALFLDALATGVALGAAVAVALAPFELKTNPLHFSAATLAYLFAGGPESAVKMIGVAAFLRRHWRAREPRDVVLAGGALALGFAGLEDLFYLAGAGSGWAALAVERALTAVPFHVFEGLTAAYVVAVRPRLAVPAWGLLAAIHGTYDFAVFAGAPGAATPEVWRRFVAACGLDASTLLRGLLAGANAASALLAGLAVRALPPGRASWLNGLLGFLLAGGAALALAGGFAVSWALDAPDPALTVALHAVAPLTLGLLFWRERARFSRRWRWTFAALGAAAGLAALIWGAGQWRTFEALRYEAQAARRAASGDREGAVEALGRAVAAAPRRIEPLAQRASLYAALHKLDAARADLAAARGFAPENLALVMALADIDRQRNDPAAVIADLEAALKLKPGDPQILALRAQAWLDSGEARRAYDDLAAASKVAPDDAMVRRVFAAWDVDAGDLEAALRDLNARLHADPADATANFQRGRVWFYKGEPARAVADFERSDQTLYPGLWRFLAERRLKRDGAGALRARLDAAPTDWPAPVALMFLGEIDAAAARARARDDGERCEADFYFALSQREDERLRPRLKAALDLCPRGFIEYEGAKAELRRLSR